MATTEAPPSVDIGALSGNLRTATGEWLKEAITEAFRCEPDLTDGQKVVLTAVLVERLDDLDLVFARELYDDLERSGVTTWGLRRDHEYLVVGKGEGGA
jgi:hypothetical protein